MKFFHVGMHNIRIPHINDFDLILRQIHFVIFEVVGSRVPKGK